MDEADINTFLRRAALDNNLNDIIDVINSTSWERILEAFPEFLHVVAAEREEIFDYLLTLPDFPIEHKFRGITLLAMAICIEEGNLQLIEKLLKNGASMDFIYTDKGERFYYFWSNRWLDEKLDVIGLLLQCGLDYSRLSLTKNEMVFECAVLWKNDVLIDQIYTEIFPKHDSLNLGLTTLHRLAQTKFEYFYDILKKTKSLRFFDNSDSAKSKNLKDFMENVEQEYWEALFEKIFYFQHFDSVACLLARTPIRTLKTIIESKVGSQVVAQIKYLNEEAVFPNNLIEEFAPDEDKILECFKFYNSYGLNNYRDHVVNRIYNKFGCGKLFEYILDQGVEIDYEDFPQEIWLEFIPWLICDPKCDISIVLKSEDRLRYSVIDLLSYTNLEEVRKACSEEDPSLVKKIPRVPLLKEYARNETRQFLIETFNIQTSKAFHNLIKNLPVYRLINDIITFKVPLYSKFLRE